MACQRLESLAACTDLACLEFIWPQSLSNYTDFFGQVPPFNLLKLEDSGLNPSGQGGLVAKLFGDSARQLTLEFVDAESCICLPCLKLSMHNSMKTIMKDEVAISEKMKLKHSKMARWIRSSA